MFFHLIDVCAWNAYVFWRELRDPSPEQMMPKNYSFLEFKKDLVLQLACVEQKAIRADVEAAHARQTKKLVMLKILFVRQQLMQSVLPSTGQYSIREALSKRELWDNRLDGGHLPVKLDKDQVCKVCSIMKIVHSADRTYRAKTSSFGCVLCGIPLCIGERNCFLLFHSIYFDGYMESFLNHS